MIGTTRRALLAAVAAVVLAALVGGTSSPPAAAAPTSQPDALSVEMVGRSPWVDVDGTLTVDLVLGEDVTDVTVHLHGQLETPEELARAASADEGPVIYTGTFPISDATERPDGSRRFSFDISATVNEGTTVRMAYAGVYPLVVFPRDGDGNTGEPVRTPVVRRSGAETTLPAPDLTVVVEVSTTPTATGEGPRRGFTAAELSRFSRLARFLQRAADRGLEIPVLVNTDTLEALAASSEPAARRLYGAVTSPDAVVIPQPIVPLDWPVLTAAGLDRMIPTLIAEGRTTAAAVASTVDDGIWDARGGVDTATLAAIADAGFDRVLVTPAAAEPDTIVERDRIAEAAPEGLRVLAVDVGTRHALLQRDDSGDAAHSALAELVLRSPDDDAVSLIVVDDVPAAARLDAVLDLLGPDGPVSVAPLDSTTEETLLSVTPRSPDVVDMAELTDLGTPISEAVLSIELFASVTTDGAGLDDLDTAWAMIAGSVQRGLDRRERTDLIDGVTQLTAWVVDDVAFVGPVDLNLTSRTGTLPLGVANGGDTTVRLVLAARSDRLGFPDGPELTVDIPPGESRLELPVEALASGSVPLFVELRSPDGAVVVAERQFNVRSTAVSGVGLALSIGALVVLVVWWIRTWRKGRAERV